MTFDYFIDTKIEASQRLFVRSDFVRFKGTKISYELIDHAI